MFTTLLITLLTAFGLNPASTALIEKTIDIDKSSLTWKGKKVTGAHEGTLKLKSGALTFEDEKLTGGTFEIDMTTIETTDLSGGMANKLVGHLKSDDFFGVVNHPIATITFTNVKKTDTGYTIAADLTIKGITHPLTFDATVGEGTADAEIMVDRTLYDVKYGSGKFFEGLGDRMIHDEFWIGVELKF